MCEKYNGWKNIISWKLSLWLNNSQGDQEFTTELARNSKNFMDFRKGIEEAFFEEIFSSKVSLVQDLLVSALGEVDWKEVWQHFRED